MKMKRIVLCILVCFLGLMIVFFYGCGSNGSTENTVWTGGSTNPTPTPTPTPTPIPTPAPQGILYVTNSAAPTGVFSFDNAATVNGDTAPDRSITNAAFATPYHLGVDAARDILYTSNGNTVLEYRNASTATGDLAPDVILGAGIFVGTGGVFSDSTNDRLYIVDIDNHQIVRFNSASSATNVTAPSGIFTTPAASAHPLNVPYGTTLDVAGDTIFVANNGNHEILTWNGAHALTGEVEPDGFIQEPTGTMAPDGLFFDPGHNELWVANQAGSVLVFGNPGGISGVTAPARTITSASFTEPTDVYYDRAADRLYVVDRNGPNSQILIFDNARLIDGAATPTRTLTGPNTTLNESTGIYVDTTR